MIFGMVILNAFFGRNEFAIGENEKYNDCHIFLHPQASGKRPLRLNSLNYQIQGFSLQLKNGLLEVLELVALFLLKTGTCDAKNS